MLAKVDFIEAISLGLVASLADVLFRMTIENGECASLGVPAEYFQGKTVVVIPALESPVAEGAAVLAASRYKTRWGRVLEIQVSDKRVAHAMAGMEAGLLLDFAVAKGVNLHLWHAPSSDLALPPLGIFGDHGPFEPP
jgi:hypothetical protein